MFQNLQKKLHSNELHLKTDMNKTDKEIYISPEKRKQIINELRLVSWYSNGISENKKFIRQYIKSII